MPRGPDFICIGLQKAGTRWLYDQLAAADGVWMPPIKEICYFNGDPFKELNLATVATHHSMIAQGGTQSEADRRFFEIFKEGQTNGVGLDWYIRLFEPKGSCLSGDVSPEYSRQDLCQIEATVRSCPDSKYVFLLRDPVSRFWSALCQGVRKGKIKEENLGQWDYVRQVLELESYQARSFPSRIWRKWSTILPPDALRFWFQEDIIARPDVVRQEVFDFVGGSKFQSPLSPSFNRKRNDLKYAMSDEIRRELAAYFDAEICEAAELFGGPAIVWKERNRTLVGRRATPLGGTGDDVPLAIAR